MMKNLILLTCITLVSYIPAYILAETTNAQSQSANKSTKAEELDIQKTIDEYKAFLATVPANVREEIVEYRKKVVEINKQKRDLYRKLSQGAQDYLKEEQKYKKKLPRNQGKEIKVQNENN